MPTSPPRSLTDDLRRRDDTALARLLQHRPDLAQPTPSDLTALASRASTRVSVHRALAVLDRPTLQVAQALVALRPPVHPDRLAAACGTTTEQLAPLVDHLRDVALVWGDDSSLYPLRAVVDLLGPHPAGLGPWLAETGLHRSPSRLAAVVQDLDLAATGDPHQDLVAAAGVLADPERVAELLERAPDQAAALLERLDASGPLGALRPVEADVRAADATTAPGWLLATGMLVAVDPEHVVLPREVALALRGGTVHRDGLELEPPATPHDRDPPDQARVDAGAAAAAAEVVRLVGELAALWEREPVPVLRGGGVGVHVLRRAASAMGVDDVVTARVVVVAGAADLVADDRETEPRWAPTPSYDRWTEQSVGQRWEHLARSWLHTPASASTVGTRGERGTVRAPLSEAVLRPAEAQLRQDVLTALAQAPEGTVIGLEALREQLAWSRPRGPVAAAGPALEGVVAEASWTGLLALGALSTAGRALAGAPGAAAAALDEVLPQPVDHVLLQADLTAVAPGPLSPAVERELAAMADVDSRGGATVYRLGPDTVRRALDAGRTGDDVLHFLAEHSRTPVPQPVEYLVRDTARRHGRMRVGAASAFVRADDEGLLTELLADRRSAGLGLHRLAPTVLAAQSDPTTVLATLRRMGLAPAAEGSDGGLVLHRPAAHRATPRKRQARTATQAAAVDPATAAAVVRALRAADAVPRTAAGRSSGAAAAASTQPPPVPVLDPATSLALLRAAASEQRRVWVGVSDPLGMVERRLLEPLSVEAGQVSAVDVARGTLRRLSVHRVTGVTDAAPMPGRFPALGSATSGSVPLSSHPDDPEER